MRPLLLFGLTAGLLAALAEPGRGEDQPRDILARAVKAHGETPEFAQRCKAFRQKIKGTLIVPGEIPFTAESFNHSDGAYKFSMKLSLDQTPFAATMVFDGARGWMQTQGPTREMDEAELRDMKQRARLQRFYSPVDLLHEKDVALTALGESQLDGSAVLGVQVKAKGMPDVNLYFDKHTGLLRKTQYREKKGRDGKDTLEEYLLLEYREVDCATLPEQILRTAKRPSDGPALLDFFRRQTLSTGDEERIRRLIQQLSDDTFAVREKASASLVEEGARAAFLLRQAARNPELEVARRAQQCLTAIDAAAGLPVIQAAAQLVAIRNPPDAAEVLLAYLPFAPDGPTAREVHAALAEVAIRDGKPDPVLVDALESKDPVRRAAAAAALGRDGGAYQEQPGRRLYPTGIKYPTKYITYQDGKKSTEHEVIEIEFFNEFEPGTFARPR
jgi:hypothetical protein